MLDRYQASVPGVTKMLKQCLLHNPQEIPVTACELDCKAALVIVPEVVVQGAHLRMHITIRVVVLGMKISTHPRDAMTPLAAMVAAHISSALAIIAESIHHLKIFSYCLVYLRQQRLVCETLQHAVLWLLLRRRGIQSHFIDTPRYVSKVPLKGLEILWRLV